MKILILEDHPLTRQVLEIALQGLGYSDTYSAESGEQALLLLREQRFFDILICDIQMPGIDGLTFLRHASEVGQIAALIISSGIASDLRLAIQQLARLSGYDVLGDLDKPFSLDVLKSLLQRYCPRTPSTPQVQMGELPSATEIQRGLMDGEFIPFYQPKINIQTGEVVGAEVLVRWQHPRLGVLSPGVFLDFVKRCGYLDDMTWAVSRQALAFLCQQGLVGKLGLSVNLEASQLGSTDLPKIAQALLRETEVPAHSLTWEITETELLLAPITSIENLVRLRLLGCGISIDDFGAGLSSLQRICETPCSELKLDASFIRSLPYNPRSFAAVDSLLRLSANLGIQLVAEGVETHEQLDKLKQLNCQVCQGYFFSRPLAGGDFIEWLQLQQKRSVTQVPASEKRSATLDFQ